MKSFLCFILCLCSTAFSATTYNSDGSSADVITKIAGAASGDTVTIPSSGSPFVWTSAISISKGIKLQGAGSGRIIGWCRSSATFGTGTKVFTVQTGFTAANGTPLRIWRTSTDKETDYMLGTVTSVAGTTLTMDITTNTSSGTHSLWLIATEPATRIIHSAGASALISLTESTAGSVDVSGIHFTHGTGTGNIFTFNYSPGGQPILLHDCWFNAGDSTVCIEDNSTTRGVIWNCSVSWPAFAQSNTQFLHMPVNSRTEVWSSPSTMGMADTTGKNNLYVEDCDFHGAQGFIDCDSNSKLVWRHNVNDHAGIGSHGYDTSAYGARHWEFYDNQFLFADVGTDSLNLINHMLMRGGTGVVTDNYFEDIGSSWWGLKNELQFGIWCLGRWGQAPGAYSADDGGVVEYPAPRQFGFGYVTGAGVDGQGHTTSNGVYVGDPEPAYVWGNTGFSPLAVDITTDGSAGVLNQYGHIPDDPNDYIMLGRDLFVDAGAKPGYTKYTYPHPLRGASPPALGHTTFSGAGNSHNSGSGTTTIAQ